ncbi:MAG: AMP-binding protein [Deltaproteobacteria bacterium]|nr:AMP-binding protein [Deltaproteobacteria bacterium]
MSDLFPRLMRADSRAALFVANESWTYAQLAAAALEHVALLTRVGVEAGDRVAVWAQPDLCTAAAMIGNAVAGVATVPLNPKLGLSELRHILGDSEPRAAFCTQGHEVPHEIAALILYTSGTTGPPKGVVVTRRNIASNLDALAEAWEWTERDTVVHSLPLIHAHGLVLGLFGSLRVGGALHYVPRFAPESIRDALVDPRHDRTMLFAVPTMIHRLAEAAEHDEALCEALRRPRLLVSGSAGLSLREHERIQSLTGRGVHERYGLTETLINCGVPASHVPMPGYVGPPLPGVELKLVDDQRREIDAHDDQTIGEVVVRSDAVFAGYLNRDDATAAVLDDDGWFHTGDLATRTEDGAIRILGRRSTDLIKTGGYRVGAGEIETCLLEHPSVREVAVVGIPDDDLGQRIAAFVVVRPGETEDATALTRFVAERLSPHKRPRDVHFTAELPRNAMGKVQKKLLGG